MRNRKIVNPQLFLNVETPISILNDTLTATLNHQLMFWINSKTDQVEHEAELMEITNVKFQGKSIYNPEGEFTAEYRAYEEFTKSMIRFGIDIDGEICKTEAWLDFTDIVNEYMPHFDRVYFHTLS